jgi:Flp pilus assembly protein CpaB
MRSNRVLVLVALILLIGAVVGGFLWWRSTGQEEEVEPTPTEEIAEYVEIVVAAQNIGVGQKIEVEDNAVVLDEWREDALPLAGYFEALEQVDGKFARVEIPRGMPVTPNMLGEPGGRLSVSGSAAALFEAGRVAYAIPMDTLGAVAWAPKPGDHVDVIAALKLVAVDEEFQSPLPNLFTSLPTGEEATPLSGTYGRFENLPNGTPALIVPSGPSLPNIIVQLTVQDAIVWNIGVWPEEEEEAGVAATPVPEQQEGVLGEGQQQQQPTPPPSPQQQGQIVKPITLLVPPQDALVLKYLWEIGADMDLALRPAGDTDPFITEPVWLRYVLDRYQIPATMPDLPVAPTPITEEQLELTPAPTPGAEE